jgi:7,8-dihydropterin-6-yl-methyl-4-(beta-D-ribofuranosyl)aminobenzene 5'-phosphate synthase
MDKERVIISILADNRTADGFVREHGLALWIEADGMRLLFDTGQGGALIPNAEKMGIHLSLTNAVILSHGHYDHTGGVAHVLSLARYPHLFCHPEALRERYSIRDGTVRSIGMQEDARAAAESLPTGRFCPSAEPFHLSKTVGITGHIPRNNGIEDTGGPFYLDPAPVRSDLLEDDMALWIRTPEGIVVCVGCAHAGIVNTLHHVISLTGPDERIRAVIGGLHLMNASDERIAYTVSALQSFAPELIVPCHCSGERAIAALTDAFPHAVRIGYAGLRIVLK